MELVLARLEDALVQPFLALLSADYQLRYGDSGGTFVADDDARHPGAFDSPGGAILLYVEDGTAVAAAAFMRVDDETAQVKRVWTAASHRRQGLSRKLLAELEAEAASRGYRRLQLWTGHNQQEAVALYLATGWTPGFDVANPGDEERRFWKLI